jgi:hypothetical protein
MSNEDNSHRAALSAALEADRRMRLRLALTVTVIGVVALSVAVWGWLGDNAIRAAVNARASAHDEPIIAAVEVPASPRKAEVTDTHSPSEVKSLDNEPNHPVVNLEAAPQAIYDAGGCSALDDTGESRMCRALFHIDQPDGSAQRLTLTCFEGSGNSRFAGRTCSWPLPKSFNPIYVNDARGCEHRDAKGKDDVEILGCLPFNGSTYTVSKP